MENTVAVARASAYIPDAVRSSETSRYLASQGVDDPYQGKTRDVYKIAGQPNGLLFVASDRISVFDHVLAETIPHKGAVLTALTHFWLTKVLAEFPHHLLPSQKDPTRNAIHDLKVLLPAIPVERCLMVRWVEVPPFEMIFRYCIGGSVYEKYAETGMAGGQQLPLGLPKWSALQEPLFTPSTKAETGHDINITRQEYLDAMGAVGLESISMFAAAYKLAYNFARERGICILDTKFEGKLIIADEVLTPDSSRYATVEDAEAAVMEKRDPRFFDKEPVRVYIRKIIKDKLNISPKDLDPNDPEARTWVDANLRLPEDIVAQTSESYQTLCKMVTQKSLRKYQNEDMYCGLPIAA